MTCDCDQHELPSTPKIQAGATSLARQIGTFADFRTAMIGDLARTPTWHRWRGRDTSDFGLMLIEMWAYVCDVVSFYDQTIANETYVRTALRRASLRKLTALIGYRPRPAVAASTLVALVASGRKEVTVPAGTGIRSSGFGAEPPQMFELDRDTTIHPFFDSWPIERTKSNLALPSSELLVERASCRVKKGDQIAIVIGSTVELRTARAVSPHHGIDGEAYVKLVLDAAVGSGTAKASDVRILRAGGRFDLIAPSVSSIDAAAPLGQLGVTGALTGIRADVVVGMAVIALAAANAKSGKLASIDQVKIDTTKVTATTTFESTLDIVNDIQTFTSSSKANVALPETTIFIGAVDAAARVLHRLTEAARLTTELKGALDPGDSLLLSGTVEKPFGETNPTTSFLLGDDQGNGVAVTGKLDYASRSIQPDQPIGKTLAAIVTAWGNVAKVSRGETVKNETLGSGDPFVASPSFTLKKRPLTYFNTPGSVDPIDAKCPVSSESVEKSACSSFAKAMMARRPSPSATACAGRFFQPDETTSSRRTASARGAFLRPSEPSRSWRAPSPG